MYFSVYLFALAAIMICLIPLVPRLLNVRICILRKIRLRRLADWHQRNFEGIIVAVRVIMAIMALILVGLGIDAMA